MNDSVNNRKLGCHVDSLHQLQVRERDNSSSVSTVSKYCKNKATFPCTFLHGNTQLHGETVTTSPTRSTSIQAGV